ncbi:hypothetical protein V5O48_017945 [Marasmius crinis-equi]|uniref:Heterokaryon incompatibility domain-containing protein n=1 Tax=Marasmius crinis-equi TaxID=585013 RepID=A0ABR3EMJ9_9AGAR
MQTAKSETSTRDGRPSHLTTPTPTAASSFADAQGGTLINPNFSLPLENSESEVAQFNPSDHVDLAKTPPPDLSPDELPYALEPDHIYPPGHSPVRSESSLDHSDRSIQLYHYSEMETKLLQQPDELISWENSHEIYSSPLSSLNGEILTISKYEPRRFRLVDCIQPACYDKLRIYEFEDISNVQYSAISYVWKSDHPGAHQPRGAFTVDGALNGDPISIDVLVDVSRASIMAGSKYLWLDRLCIIQTDHADKNWQIKKMNYVYSSCLVCIVLPDGIGHLVDLDKKTSWINRGWTLQEAAAPKQVVVLFAWIHGPGALILDFDERGSVRVNVDEDAEQGPEPERLVEVTEVTRGRCAVCPIGSLLTVREIPLVFRPEDPSSHRHVIVPAVFGYSETRIGSLRNILDRDLEERYRTQAIWRSALTRASSRPVDMIFSIMGLFGVTLNTGDFDDDDRLGATVALAQEIVKNGDRPSWLVMSHDIPPCQFLSSFPEFPISKEWGKVTIQGPQGEIPIDDLIEYGFSRLTDNIPDAVSMDDEGYLTIHSMVIPVTCLGMQPDFSSILDVQAETPTSPHHLCLEANDGQVWETVYDGETGTHGYLERAGCRTYAVVFGRFFDRLFERWKVEGALVERHASGKFHRTSAFTRWLRKGDSLTEVLGDWEWRNISIGGPLPIPQSGKPRQKSSAGIVLNPSFTLGSPDVITVSNHSSFYVNHTV